MTKGAELSQLPLESRCRIGRMAAAAAAARGPPLPRCKPAGDVIGAARARPRGVGGQLAKVEAAGATPARVGVSELNGVRFALKLADLLPTLTPCINLEGQMGKAEEGEIQYE